MPLREQMTEQMLERLLERLLEHVLELQSSEMTPVKQTPKCMPQ